MFKIFGHKTDGSYCNIAYNERHILKESFVDPFLLFMFLVCLYYAVLSVHCSLVITC